jgi:glycine oxidase
MPPSDVVIIGGGVIGCAIAHYLTALTDAQVTVLEKGAIGGQATNAAAGMLAPLAESDEPSPFLDLGLASLRLFPALAAELRETTGIDIELTYNGLLRVAMHEEEAEQLQANLRWQSAYGLPLRWLDAREVRAVEPLAGPTLCGALYSEGEPHVASLRLARALAESAARRGAQLLEGQQVIGLVTARDRVVAVRTLDGEVPAGQVVLAAGAWSAIVAEWLGAREYVPVFPIRGQILALKALPRTLRHTLYTREGYVVPKGDGSLIVGATEDQAGFDTRVQARGIATLLDVLKVLAPDLREMPFERAWAGLRPCSADKLPILGMLPGWENVVVAAGHYRNGILLSLITGQTIATLLVRGESDPLLQPFWPERFGEDEVADRGDGGDKAP